MTIRRILLTAFLLVGLLPSTVLTALAFTRTRAAMQEEIERSLAVQATSVGADIDKMLFERLQNATTWNHLEVMQDLQVGDVDKRLSDFLAEMKLRYGDIYTQLHAVDAAGLIVASSNPADIGRNYPRAAVWHALELPGGRAQLHAPMRDDAGHATLVVRAPIQSRFGNENLGELLLLCDWRAFERALDRAAGGSRGVLVQGADGVAVAASASLRRQGIDSGRPVGGWRGGEGAAVRDGMPLQAGPVVAGYADSQGYDAFAGFGWNTVVVQPLQQALAPVRRMAWTFLTLLGATALVTVAVASWVSARIARPIVRLTDYTRRFAQEPAMPEAPPPAEGEVGELTRSFVQMVEDLDKSRQTLVRASKLAAVGEIAAVMAHEIRTPLGVLKTSAQMLESEPGLSSEGRELLGFIRAETDRLNRLVTEMLNSARVREPRRVCTDIGEVLQRSLLMLRAQAQRQEVSLQQRFEAGDAHADADAEQLTQVFLNLLVNALQVVPAGGSITARVLDGEGDTLIVEIADDGPGLPPGEHRRIFEPFVYQREGGLGLGLAVVEQIVSAHGGTVAALDNPAGRGAMFRIGLPRHRTPET